MVATPSRIAFVQREFRVVSAKNATIETRYGANARRDQQPVPSFLDTVSDAQSVADERIALLGAARRRFDVTVQGLDEAIDILAALQSYTASQVDADRPVVQYVDETKGIDMAAFVVEIELDFGSQSATLKLWG